MKIKHHAMLALVSGVALAAPTATERLMAAANVFSELMNTKDKLVPQDLLDKSQCVIIVPALLEGGFIFGGKYGKGFMSCRQDGGMGWSAPGAVRIEGGSFGFQAGGEAVDIFMLVLNKKGEDKLLSTKVTLGGDISASAGPVGRATMAQTDAAMSAEILTYSRSKGLFAGAAFTGSTLRSDDDWNKELYGKAIKNREIITGGSAAPAAAAGLMEELNKFSPRK